MSGTASALLAKRNELVARRRDLKGDLTKLARDIAALDRVMALLEPSYQAEAPRPNRARGRGGPSPFGHGEMTSAALFALRELGTATTSECAAAMLAAKGLAEDEPSRSRLASKVAAVFGQKEAAGQLRRAANGDGRQVRWEVAR